MILYLRIILSLLSIGLIPCAGQVLRTVEFTAYGQYPVRNAQYSPVSEAAVAAGAKPEPPIRIETHSLARMGPYSFTGENIITFTDPDSQSAIAQVKLPEHSNKWLLVFVRNPRFKSDPDNQPQYLIYPFDDSLKNLPNNGLVFINITGKEIDGLLEDKQVKLTAGESNSYSVQESLPVNLWTRHFDGEQLLPALIKTYHFEPNHRYLMIFFPPVLRGSVDLDVRFLSEKVE